MPKTAHAIAANRAVLDAPKKSTFGTLNRRNITEFRPSSDEKVDYLPGRGNRRSTVIRQGIVTASSVSYLAGIGDRWADTMGDLRVVITVLDGPVDKSHPTLAGAHLIVLEGTALALPQPGGLATQHGTLVASLIFGQHCWTSPAQGIAPGS